MSHFASIQTEIRDLEALAAACNELNLPLLRDTEARGFGTNRRRGELVIRLKGPYDIALNRQKTGAYSLECDWWAGHVEKELGQGCGRLLQLYGVYKAQAEARRKGYTTRRQTLKDGSIRLTIGGL